ncbi:MAG: hypothetical protein V1690_01125 [Candidatus Moraniibacteriota bacterium]
MKHKRAKKNHRHYRKHLHAATKIHAVATVLFLGFYFSFAFVFGPKILYQDLLEKYDQVKAAVVTVTAYVPGPPGKPDVTASSRCDSNYQTYVNLSWATTIDTDYYDIYRGGELLAENLTATSYNDIFVQSDQIYTYQITAKGVKGETASDENNITVSTCEQPYIPPPTPTPPPPVIEIPKIVQLLINGKPIPLNTPVIPRLKKKKLTIAGIASVPKAIVKIEIYSKKKIAITLVANDNGYWKLKKFPKNLKKGIHNLYITTINPNDSSKIQTYSLTFCIGRKHWVSSGKPIPGYFREVNHLFAQSYAAKDLYPLEISGKTGTWLSGTAYLGKKIEGEIKLNGSVISKETPLLINYKIVDQKNKTVLEKTDTQELNPDTLGQGTESIPYSIQIPYSLKEGKYKLMAWFSDDNSYLSDEMPLQIKELPLLTIGRNTKITCSNLINYTGWIAAISFATLVLVSILTLIEYHLSKDAPLHISEDELGREGLIS